MCVLCGVLLSDHWAEREGGARERTFRVRLVNRVLAHYRLSLDDWSGAVYTLRDSKGAAVVVSDLGSLWAEAERMLGRKLDPLDPDLVAALAGSKQGEACLAPTTPNADRRGDACVARPPGRRNGDE